MLARLKFCLGAVLALWCLASVALAQNFEEWETLATRAEQATDRAQASDAVFETLRAAVIDYRTQFDAARSQNADRISTLRDQIAALGPAPEAEGQEPLDVAATRADLTEQLNSALVPVQRAEAAFVRAEAIVGQIDRILRARQTDELFEVSPTPLNPAAWPRAVDDLLAGARILWQETPEGVDEDSTTALREDLPIAILFGLLGLVLIWRGRLWSRQIVQRMQQWGARGFGIWRFVVSLLSIVLPVAGIALLGIAVISTQLFGPTGNEIILTISALAGLMLAVRWVGERVFSRDEDEALIALPTPRRAEVRFYVSLITFMIVLGELLVLVVDSGYPAAASKSVLVFPIFLVSSLALFRISVLLRSYKDVVQDDAETDEPRTTTFSRVIRALGTGGIVVACAAPLLMAAGYFNAADGLLPPYIMTLVMLGLVIVLQRFAADVYGAVTGQGAAARDSLLPVLMGIALLLASIPVLALIWGMRVTDLTELWAALGRGFAIGESRISPGDFLAFAVIFAIGYVLTRLVQSALRTNVLPKTRIDAGGQNAIVAGLGYVGIFLAALAAITGAGIDLSSIAIVAGALSVGIGFGLQNVVNNFVSGIILLIERPISEGDWIDVGGKMGYVRNISVRSTRIETFDKSDVIVPNADLISGTVTNYTRGNTIGRVIVSVGVAYGTDTRKVEAILREIAEAQPMVLASPPPAVLFLNFGADALEFEVRCFLRDVNWMMTVKNNINHAIAERFAAEGIEIPFAQRDLWIRNPEALRSNPTEGEA